MQFDFKQSLILEDERVLLRPLEAADFHHLLTFSQNEPEIWSFNAGGPEGAERLEQYITNALEQRRQEREYPFIVYDKATGRYAGSTRYYDILPQRATLQVGFTWYGKDFRSTGLNKHCKYLLFGHAFDTLGAARIGLGANAKNFRSINAMKSIGCTVEGILRSAGLNAAGERIDSIVLGMLRQEWDNGLKERLGKQLGQREAPNVAARDAIFLTRNNDDLRQCAALMNDSEPWTTLQFSFDKCMLSLVGIEKEVYVVTADGQFAGFVVLNLAGVLRGYIQTVCVAPEFRSRGLGTRLLQYAEDRILRMSPHVFICVSSFNPAAKALYERLGFREMGILKDHLVAGYDEIILRKSQGPWTAFVPA